MNSEYLPVVLAFVTTVIGPILTYLVARRSKSGKIRSSEAEDLWTESKNIRGELREDVVRLTEENAKLHDEIATKSGEITRLSLENITLKSRNEYLERKYKEAYGGKSEGSAS